MAATPTPISTSNPNAIVAQIVTDKLGAIPLPTSDTTLFQPEVMKGSRRNSSRDKRKINEDELAPKESVPEDLAQAELIQAEPLQLAQAETVTAETAAVTATTAASAEATAITVSATEAAEIGAVAAGGGTSSAVVATETSAAAIGADAATAVGVASANAAGTAVAAATTAATTGVAASSAGGVSGGFSGMLAGAGIGMGTAVAGAAAVGIGVGVVASAKEPANAPPVAVEDAFTTAEETPLNLTVADLLGNDRDAEGNPLSLASITNGTGGTVIRNADGSITFTPTLNFNGIGTFSYAITDGTNSSSAQVRVNVTQTPDAPTLATITSGSTTETDQSAATTGQALSGTLVGVDADAGTVLVYGITDGAVSGTSSTLAGTYGTLTVDTSTGAYSYAKKTAVIEALDASENVSDTFTITVLDGSTTTMQTYTVSVTGADDAPTIRLDSRRLNQRNTTQHGHNR